MKEIKIPVRVKVVASFAIMLIILSAVVSAVSYFLIKGEFIDQEYSHAENMTHQKILLIDQLVNETKLTVEAISKQDTLKEFLVSESGESSEGLLKTLQSYNIGNSYSAIYLMDRTGMTLASTNNSFIGKNYNFRPYYSEAKKFGESTYLAKGVTSGEMGYYFSHAIYGDDEEFLGVVVMKMFPEKLNSVLVSEENEKIRLVTESGIIIYSDISDEVYKSVGLLTEDELNNIDESRQFESLEIESLGYDELNNIIREDEKHAVRICDDFICQKGAILMVYKIDSLPLFTVVEKDLSVFSDRAEKLDVYFSLVIIGFGILVLIFVFLMSGKFLQPLNEILDTIKSVSVGKLNVSANVNTKDEFGVIASELNKMIENLKRTNIEIENRVNKRTEQLNVVNSLMIGREKRMVELKEEIKKMKNSRQPIVQNDVVDIDWYKKFNEAIELEESVIGALENTYKKLIKESKLDTEKKNQAMEMIQYLVDESKEHDASFEKLAEKYKK